MPVDSSGHPGVQAVNRAELALCMLLGPQGVPAWCQPTLYPATELTMFLAA